MNLRLFSKHFINGLVIKGALLKGPFFYDLIRPPEVDTDTKERREKDFLLILRSKVTLIDWVIA